MKKWGLLLILLLSLLPRTTFAEETADAICIEGETEGLDTDAVDAATEEMDAEVSFSDLLAEILSGEFDFTFANIKEKASGIDIRRAAHAGQAFGTAGADCHSECNSEAVQ